jgi:hypothetical protein
MGGVVEAVTTVVGAAVGFFVAGPIGLIIGAGLGYASADIVNAIINPGFDVPTAGFNQAEQQNQGVLVNKAGTNNSIPVIYGRRRVGGTRVFVSTEGENNKYLHIVLAVSEGEIAGYDEIYCDDFLAWSGSTTHGQTYEANQGKYAGNMTFQAFHGTTNQTASSLTLGVGGWSNQHRLRGIAYISFRLKWLKIESAEDQDNSPWSNIPNITIVTRGRKVADATLFANSITRGTAYNSESTIYTLNPISCLLDFLRNPIYGKGLSNDKINFKSFRDEATRWSNDTNGNFINENSSQFHQINAVIFTDRSLFDNTKTLLFNCRAALPYQDGRFSVRVEDNRNDTSTYGRTSTSAMTVGEDQIIGSVNLEGDNVKGKVNRVIVTYMGGRQGNILTNESVEYTYPEPDTALANQYLDEDNNRVNELRLTFEHITQDSVARKYAEVALKKSRFRSKILSFTGDASLHQLQVNDIFTMVHSGLGINGKFRVKSIQFNADYTFSIIAEEHNDNVYGGEVVPYQRKTPTVSTTGSSIPVYRDTITGDIVHIGNKSDAPLPPDYVAPSTVPTEYATVPVKYTAQELNEALATGRVIAIVDGDIILAEPDVIPKPVITSATVGYDQYGQYEIRIFFEKSDEPSIEAVKLLVFNHREQKYFQNQYVPSSTAMRDGFLITTTNTDRSRFGEFNVKIQFAGKNGNLVETSEAVTIDFTGLVPNNIVFEEF